MLSDSFSLSQLASTPPKTHTLTCTLIYNQTESACTAQAGCSSYTSGGQARQEVTLHLCLMMEVLVCKAIWRMNDRPPGSTYVCTHLHGIHNGVPPSRRLAATYWIPVLVGEKRRGWVLFLQLSLQDLITKAATKSTTQGPCFVFRVV